LTLRVRTDNRRWPVSSVTFRLDELRPGLFHGNTESDLAPPTLRSAIRHGCVIQTAHEM
jgi:hypothetical protein